MLERILVPLDGSETAEAILPQLRRLLLRHESEVLLLEALSPFSLQGEDQEKYLRRMAFQLTKEGYPSRYLLKTGPAADLILETAKVEGASLIALSTHGRTGAARWILGSVAEKVLERSLLPVLVARSFPSTLSRGNIESRPIRNFLVPLDGSRISLEALESLRVLAGPVDAHVTLLHVTEPSPVEGHWPPSNETLTEAERGLREACIPTTLEHRKGDPGVQILKLIGEKEIDLVAMTTHGRSGPSRWVFGSVTAQVLRAASIPLLIVRHPASVPSGGVEALQHSVE